jgi:hypothetical protein
MLKVTDVDGEGPVCGIDGAVDLLQTFAYETAGNQQGVAIVTGGRGDAKGHARWISRGRANVQAATLPVGIRLFWRAKAGVSGYAHLPRLCAWVTTCRGLE